MRVLYSPQRSDEIISYTFNGEIITCEYNGQTDIFDFSSMPDGIIQEIETVLPCNPIVSARRENGVLYVSLLYFHGADAIQEELYPEWQEVG